jgi:hypothetical protein
VTQGFHELEVVGKPPDYASQWQKQPPINHSLSAQRLIGKIEFDSIVQVVFFSPKNYKISLFPK